MLGVRVPVGTCKPAQGDWDAVFFARLVSNVEFELLQKLEGPHKPQIESHCRGCGCDQGLLENVDYH